MNLFFPCFTLIFLGDLVVDGISMEFGFMENPLITNLTDETEMRHRMEDYAKEKFRHKYHYFIEKNGSVNDSTKLNSYEGKRVRRDGGVVSGPVSMAILSGVIGLSLKRVFVLLLGACF